MKSEKHIGDRVLLTSPFLLPIKLMMSPGFDKVEGTVDKIEPDELFGIFTIHVAWDNGEDLGWYGRWDLSLVIKEGK